MEQPSFGTRLARAFRNLVLLTLFLGLGGAAIYATSIVNERTFSLEVRGGQLVVLKASSCRPGPTRGFQAIPGSPTRTRPSISKGTWR